MQMKHTLRNLARAKAREREGKKKRDLTQRSCKARLGTEGEEITPGWDKHFGGTSWWSEDSHLPKAAGTIKTNWSLLAASMQAPM